MSRVVSGRVSRAGSALVCPLLLRQGCTTRVAWHKWYNQQAHFFSIAAEKLRKVELPRHRNPAQFTFENPLIP
jgi:hypothetical protein